MNTGWSAGDTQCLPAEFKFILNYLAITDVDEYIILIPVQVLTPTWAHSRFQVPNFHNM